MKYGKEKAIKKIYSKPQLKKIGEVNSQAKGGEFAINIDNVSWFAS